MSRYKIINLDQGDQVTNTAEAIEASGLDWKVASGPLQVKCFNRETMQYDWKHLKSHKGIYRIDSGNPLGNCVVGKGFELVQNVDAFRCFDEIIQKAGATFTAGGWFHNGASVFLQAKLPQEVNFESGDSLNRYLLIAQGHTGQQCLSMRFTNIRPVCSNTLYAALRDTQHSFSLRHTASIHERVAEAIKFMHTGMHHLEEAERKFQIMNKLMTTREQELNFLKLAYDRPMDEDMKDWRKWKSIEPIYDNAKGAQYSKGTLWHPFNVISEYEDHHSRVNRSTGETDSIMSDSLVKDTRRIRAFFGTNTVGKKTNAFRLADDVIGGRLDLNTGKRRTPNKEWVSFTAGLAGAMAVQQLLV